MTITDPIKQEQDIVVQIAQDFEDLTTSLAKLEELVRVVCNRFGLSKATVSVAIVDDAHIRTINKRFLDRDRPTDCLSFDLSDEQIADESKQQDPPKIFELVVNGEKAVREANLRGHTGEAELALYVTHALLHQFGFDDSTPQEAGKMHRTEDEILEQQGYGLVYNTDRR